MPLSTLRRIPGSWLLCAGLLLTAVVYGPGLHGSWLFDDYPNIVDNHGVQPAQANLASLLNAALSSPASEFKRPLASLSFAANYLAIGLDPFGWKLSNLLIHLLNGVLVFLLARMLLQVAYGLAPVGAASAATRSVPFDATPVATEVAPTGRAHADIVAALVAIGWMLLPINLTGVLYVVQRMESLANLFVLLGLIGYIAGRRRMLAPPQEPGELVVRHPSRGLWLCIISVILPTATGVLAKETAVMLPLYALLVECLLFRFRAPATPHRRLSSVDWRLVALFMLVLALPMLAGLAWLLPDLLRPESWATRDFTLGTRLLSEMRIVIDYIGWSLLPIPHELSFYHDDFIASTDLFHPWTTLASLLALVALIGLGIRLRRRQPLVSLGLALFLGCHLLTATILPLELIYEHRNYFASFGLLLAVVPWLMKTQPEVAGAHGAFGRSRFVVAVRYAVLAMLFLSWTVQTATTAYAWGEPLRLARELATRGPDSPRAQYELGRTYIIYSHYEPASPYTRQAYAPLEHAALLPGSSILPQQALIFMNSRMHLPSRDIWWDSMIDKLKARRPGVQDESSLATLVQCARDGGCDLPRQRMVAAFDAALAHPQPSARLLATYGDYAWNVLADQPLGERLTEQAVQAAPDESAYRITLVRMLLALERDAAVPPQMDALRAMNIGGRLDGSIQPLQQRIDAREPSATSSQTH